MATIREYVTRNVVSLDAEATAADAARVMAERRIGSVGVREGGRIVGIVTERDLVANALAQECDVDLAIREAMRPLPRVSPRTSEVECLAIMRDQYTRHLLVEEDGEVVGIVSMRDLIQLMLDEKEYVIGQLNAYIHG